MKTGTFFLYTLVFLALIFTSCNSSGESKKPLTEKKYRIVGYAAGYQNFDFSKIDASKLTHINYAFANVTDGKVQFDNSLNKTSMKPEDINILTGLKKDNPELKVLVSVGGWAWSGNFSDAALTPASRLKFANSAAAFVKKYNLDGIDIDWEYPNQPGAGNKHRPEDTENFTLLLKAVRQALDDMAKKEGSGKHYLLTIASGADETYIENTRLGEAQKYLDFINIMTYDFYNGWHKVTGHHSNLNPSALPDKDMNSCVNAVDLHLKAGVPADKLTLGIPFYGRKWTGVKSDENNGLFQEASSIGMIDPYRNIKPLVNKNGYVRYWDQKAKAPYLWNPEKKVFISYDDPESIALKIRFLKKKGLSGVMFWEYSDDYKGELLNAVYNDLEKK